MEKSGNFDNLHRYESAMQELRGNKKLVYFSAINADKGSTDYFRYKRLGEDNANLLVGPQFYEIC